jgi:integrase
MAGHIRRRGVKSWEIKFDLGSDPSTGERRTRYKAFKGTKREAEAELTKLKAAADQGNHIDGSKLTAGEFLATWMRDWGEGHLSPKTSERFLELIAANVVPHIGALRLQQIKPVNCAELYGTLLREGRKCGGGLAPRTVGQVHRMLHRAFGHAQKWGLVSSNPCSLVEPPKVRNSEIQILTDAEVHSVLQKLRGRPMYMLAAVGLSTGLRRGELLALRWEDIDFNNNSLQVERSLEQTKRGLRIKEPKTQHGRRRLALPASIAAELRKMRREQHELRLSLGVRRNDDSGEYVFSRPSGHFMRPDNVSGEWRRLVKVLHLPKVTLHAWRHTHASQLISLGFDVLTISRRLGHGSPSITLNVYGHLFPGTDDRAASRIDAAFSRALAN